MNNHQIDIAILQRLLQATLVGRIKWQKDPDQWFAAEVGDDVSIVFRFLYYDSTNKGDADPLMIEFSMPGRNAVFACGTEGFDLLLEILSAAFDEWKVADPYCGLRFLDEVLPE